MAETVPATGIRVTAAVAMLVALLLWQPPAAAGMLVHGTDGRDMGEAADVAVRGDHAFVLDIDGNLWVLDVSNPGWISQADLVSLPANPARLVLEGKYLYVAARDSGLMVFDVSQPEQIEEVARFEEVGDIRDVTVVDSRAYLSSRERLWIVDVTDPPHPTLMLNLTFQDDDNRTWVPIYTAVVGDLLYTVASDESFRARLFVVDLSDPYQPEVLGSMKVSWAGPISISGNLAAIASGGWGVEVWNISDPTSITYWGRLDFTPGWAYDVVVKGTHAYVTCGKYGLRVVDISRPEPYMREVGNYVGDPDVEGSAEGLVIKGNTLYMAYGYKGLAILDISSPAQPRLLSTGSILDPVIRELPAPGPLAPLLILAAVAAQRQKRIG